MKSPQFSHGKVDWWCDCLTEVTEVQQLDLQAESLWYLLQYLEIKPRALYTLDTDIYYF